MKPIRSRRAQIEQLEKRSVPTTFIVNSLMDDAAGSGDAGTLRYCIAQANALAGPDSIDFAVIGTMLLANGQFTLSDTTGTTTINGPGAGLLTINAQLASRVFQINAGVTASISGLTMINGKVSSGSGGAIANIGGTVSIAESVINNNSVTGNGSNGGGILNQDGHMSVSKTVISNNTSGIGGGIRSLGGSASLTITDSTITANTAGSGAGIRSGALTITNSTVSANAASSSGGGISAAGAVTIANCNISANTAKVQGGGGILASGTITITHSTISGNLLPSNDDCYGAGIYFTGGKLTVSDSTITANSVSHGNGGGIACRDDTTQVTNCIITNNSAKHVSGTVGRGNGGGIANWSGNVIVTTSTIGDNSALRGGGIWNSANQAISLTVSDSTLIGNKAEQVGGGIYNSSGNGSATATVVGSTIVGNTANQWAGIGNSGSAKLSITNSTISGNSATVNAGGIYNHISGMLYAINTIIAGNQASVNPDLLGNLTSNINNLVNVPAGVAGLGVLGNYGGPTQTIPLVPGSPAINAGTSTGAPVTDQRGLPRFGAVDIGAFEVQPPVTIGGTLVNNGFAQRSRVTALTITFDSQVMFSGSVVDAFTMTRIGGNAVDFSAVAEVISGTSVVTLTNFVGPETEFASLRDGNFVLTVLASQINGGSLDGNGDGTPGDDYTFNFHRLFGDADGNATVNAFDFAAFRSAFGTGTSIFDFNNDGQTNAADFAQFRARFGTTLSP